MAVKNISLKRFSIILAILGLVLSLGGLSILSKTGSYYFTVIGGLICLSGTFMAFRQIAGVYLFMATVILIVAWSMIEVGFQFNLILPRITVPIILLFCILRPAFRSQFNNKLERNMETSKFNDTKTLLISFAFMVMLAAYLVYTQRENKLSTLPVDQQVVGIWRDVEMLVFVKIEPNGDAYQCRIAQDQSVIVASGSMVSQNVVKWGKVSSWESDGKLVDFYIGAPGFTTWGEEKITLKDNQIILTSNQGSFPQVSVELMPPICGYHKI